MISLNKFACAAILCCSSVIPSAQGKTLNDSTKPFDWEDYIVIFERNQYIDNNGNPIPNTDNKNKENYEYMVKLEQLWREEHEDLKKVLDQLSLIPEFQKIITKAHNILSEKILKDKDLADESDGKIRIILPAGRDGFSPTQFEISMDPCSWGIYVYRSDVGRRYTTAQEIIIHESLHATQKGAGPEQDLERSKVALEEAVKETLKIFPEHKKEYYQKGSIIGRPVLDLFFEKAAEIFDDKYLSNVLQGMDVRIPIDRIGKAISNDVYGKNTPIAVLNSMYRANLLKIQVEVDETPVMNRTNEIMLKYFGDPMRTSYEVDKNLRGRGDCSMGGPNHRIILKYTYPALQSGLPRAATKACPDPQKPCDKGEIPGASRKEYRP